MEGRKQLHRIEVHVVDNADDRSSCRYEQALVWKGRTKTKKLETSNRRNENSFFLTVQKSQILRAKQVIPEKYFSRYLPV